jgi:hypothetical protein
LINNAAGANPGRWSAGNGGRYSVKASASSVKGAFVATCCHRRFQTTLRQTF